MRIEHCRFQVCVAITVGCLAILISGCGGENGKSHSNGATDTSVENETAYSTNFVAEGAKNGTPHSKSLGGTKAESEEAILLTIKEIPKILNNPSRTRTALLLNSNICDNVRLITSSGARRKYVDMYTNVVAKLDFPVDVDLGDKTAARTVWINLENYSVLVDRGASMLCECETMNPEVWDFLLTPPTRYRHALDLRTRRLMAASITARRFRTDALFNELRDGLSLWARMIDACWYPAAKRKMSPGQLAVVRQKVKNALGELPPGMAKEVCEDN